MNSIIGEEKFTDTDQVSPNAEEQYHGPLYNLKRRNKEQEKQAELIAKQEREALNAEALTEDQIGAQKLLTEQEAGLNQNRRQVKETTSLDSQIQINTHNEFCTQCQKADALVTKHYEGNLVCQFCGDVA